jgi:mitochondrial chaperone BCS1
MIPGEEEDGKSVIDGSRKIAYFPSVSTTQSFWYKRRWVSITRSQQETGFYGRKEEYLQIRYDLG